MARAVPVISKMKLSMAWLTSTQLSSGVHIIPAAVEQDAARLALRALGQDAR